MWQKNIILVLGIGRSGTSVIIKALAALGVNLGKNLLSPNVEWNPKGYYENELLLSINEDLLRILKCTWNSLYIDYANINSTDFDLTQITQKATQILQEEFDNSRLYGFKDPRTARLLPFWQKQFKVLDINDKYIIALRNPLSSALSYNSLTNIKMEKFLYLWLVNMIAAITYSENKTRIIVSYELMMENPLKQLNRIKNAFNLTYELDQIKVHEFVDEFLTEKLVRFGTSYNDFKSHPAAPPVCIDAYNLLKKIANDEMSFDDNEFLNGWASIKQINDNLKSLYKYCDELNQNMEPLFNDIRILNNGNALLTLQNNQFRAEIHCLRRQIQYVTLNGILRIPMKFIYRTMRFVIAQIKKLRLISN